MSNDQDFAELPLEQLREEKKKIKRQELTGSIFVGFLIGVIIYGVATKGFGFLHIFLPGILIAAAVRYSQVL